MTVEKLDGTLCCHSAGTYLGLVLMGRLPRAMRMTTSRVARDLVGYPHSTMSMS
jgi:hypothetical protein